MIKKYERLDDYVLKPCLKMPFQLECMNELMRVDAGVFCLKKLQCSSGLRPANV